MKCIIVESPAKAKKFSTMLPTDQYIVTSSFGHFRNLDPKCMSINMDSFEPQFIITNQKIAKQLREYCKKVGKENIILAPDEDREGEAIGYHIAELLKIPFDKTQRIKFNEISKKAILKALETPVPLDMNWVNSQKGRQVLDKLIGFSLSPLLWKHIPNKLGLSAGRVQSAALKIINEKEQEIKDYKCSYKFDITAKFDNKYDTEYILDKSEKNPSEDTIEDIMVESISNLEYKIVNHDSKQKNKNPPPPFTTSTLQQEATNSGINVKTTMNVAQKLYEAGLITYMRTDSVNLSNDFIEQAKGVITEKYTDKYFTERHFKTKTKGAQEAHEAIRPTDPSKETIEGDGLLKKIYQMIYKRTLASQMSTSVLNVFTFDISNGDIKGVYHLEDTVIKFDGWQKIYNKEVKTSNLINIGDSKVFKMNWVKSTETPNSPPARYTESSVIKTLESTGIGRPSTFASTLETLYKREYVEKKLTKKETIPRKTLVITAENPEEIEESNEPLIRQPQKDRLFISKLGETVLAYLIEHFDSIINRNFTSEVEDKLDEVASGKVVWNDLVKEVFDTFNPTVQKQLENCKSIIVSRNNEMGQDEDMVFSTGRGKFGPYLLVKKKDQKKGKFYNLEYFMKNNEKTLEEVTMDDAKQVVLNYENYLKTKSDPKPTGEKAYIKIKYDDKEKAKKLGARWDKEKKSWYIYGDKEEFLRKMSA